MAGPASPASAKTLKACYNKKSGQMVFLKHGNCKRGWKKYTWNTKGVPGNPGAPGPQGPAGPQLSVKDKNGVLMGTFMGFMYYGGGDPTINVLNNGGLYGYNTDGYLQPAATVVYTSAMYLRTVGS